MTGFGSDEVRMGLGWLWTRRVLRRRAERESCNLKYTPALCQGQGADRKSRLNSVKAEICRSARFHSDCHPSLSWNTPSIKPQKRIAENIHEPWYVCRQGDSATL